MPVPQFMPGLELARLYYTEAVKPILQAYHPGLGHSAGLIGPGSEVLGFDTGMSSDHSWGPRVILYLSEQEHAQRADDLRWTLGHELPFTFRGYPTHFEEVPGDPGSVVPGVIESRPINHLVQITTLRASVGRYIGIDPDQEMSVADWLTVPEQQLRSLVAGAVYHDGLDVLEPLRCKLAYYPHDVWLYLLSAQWQRIGQEEPFVGRSGLVGDDVGSAIIAARLVRDLMRLALLMEKEYAPYSKWFGSAFAQLDCAADLTPALKGVLRSATWQDREQHLISAYEILATMHNDLGITEPVPAKVSQFHNRPFMVIQGEAIGRALWAAIQDGEVRSLPYGLGKVDQYVDSTDVLSHIGRCRALATLYAE